MIRSYVAITDTHWFELLSQQPHIDEVNFWKPSGNTNFHVLQPGELFLFKLKSPWNFIVGGGVFCRASILPISVAWEAFGIKNGCATYEEFQAAIVRNRAASSAYEDFNIGCRILTQPFFWPRDQWMGLPSSWSRLHGPGRSISFEDAEGLRLWEAVQERQTSTPTRGLTDNAQAKYGDPILIKPRLGQGAFRIAVTEAYSRKCVITGERTLLVLDAAHIRPYGRGGHHELTNGLLLRKDIHTLFDLGYVTVSSDFRFEVSSRIKEKFENGRDYYAMQGVKLAEPKNPAFTN